MSGTAESGYMIESFRDLMACVCGPVCVVVTALAEEAPHGTTVSAFTSLSLNPPMVLVALDTESQLLAILRSAGRFSVNILGTRQADLARRFAVKGRDDFAGVGWSLECDVPRLDGVHGWLACEVDALVPGGDHVVVLGKVLAADAADATRSEPLTYHRRTFGTHASIEGLP
ncbi:flavin reductase family protein [Mycolicibacterium sp. XJ1819]